MSPRTRRLRRLRREAPAKKARLDAAWRKQAADWADDTARLKAAIEEARHGSIGDQIVAEILESDLVMRRHLAAGMYNPYLFEASL